MVKKSQNYSACGHFLSGECTEQSQIKPSPRGCLVSIYRLTSQFVETINLTRNLSIF